MLGHAGFPEAYLEVGGVRPHFHSSKTTLQHPRMPIVPPITLRMSLDPARPYGNFLKLSEAREGGVMNSTRGLFDVAICWQFDLHS